MIERISKNRKRIIITAKDYSLLTIGAIFMAINFNVFMSPTQIAPGGIGGIVLILTRYLRLSEGTLFLILQAIMIAIGFRHLGRFQFLVRVIYVSVLYSLGVDFLKPWLPAAGITNDLLLNSVYGGIVGGIGSGLIFLGRSSGAGTNVISRAIQMRTGIPISQLYIYIDGAIIVLLGFFFGWDRALYGMMMLFIWGIAADYVQEGPSVVRTAFIITDQPETVAKAIISKLQVGVTSWDGKGMFTHADHTVLFCTINRVEMGTLKNIVQETDPNAFFVVGQGHQAVGGIVRHKGRDTNTIVMEPKI